MSNASAHIPVSSPRLPGADDILPYLRAIDETKRYTNGGPLVAEFEQRAAGLIGIDQAGVAAVSSGTAGLSLALGAAGAAPGSLCLMPAWTFVATAHAARAAHLIPYFADVSPTTWCLEPDEARRALTDAPAPVGAIVPVSPFGAPVDTEAWQHFADDTGIPVVVDAAAGFDSLEPIRSVSVVSLHATKVPGIGEGGLVVARDPARIEAIRRRANFAFDSGRRSLTEGCNAKLSEYAAAVGLAALDHWSESQAAHVALSRTYRGALSGLHGVTLSPGFGDGWAPSTCTVLFSDIPAQVAAVTLAAKRIETRAWWGMGCHRHPAFADCPRTILAVTDDLAAHTLGLPFHLAMDRDAIRAIVAALGEATGLAPEADAIRVSA